MGLRSRLGPAGEGVGAGGWRQGCLFSGRDGGWVSPLKLGEPGPQAGGRGLGLGWGVGQRLEGTQTDLSLGPGLEQACLPLKQA